MEKDGENNYDEAERMRQAGEDRKGGGHINVNEISDFNQKWSLR